MTKPLKKTERKVLRIFGKVYSPANWSIFLAGILLFFVGIATFWFEVSTRILGVIILTIQGVQLAVDGYGEIKEDEDIDGN